MFIVSRLLESVVGLNVHTSHEYTVIRAGYQGHEYPSIPTNTMNTYPNNKNLTETRKTRDVALQKNVGHMSVSVISGLFLLV